MNLEYVTAHKGPFNPSKVINQAACNRAAKFGVSELKNIKKTGNIEKEISLKRKYDDEDDITVSNKNENVNIIGKSIPSSSTLYHSRSNSPTLTSDVSIFSQNDEDTLCDFENSVNRQDNNIKKVCTFNI